MFQGFNTFYSDAETCTLLVKRQSDGVVFQAYHDGEAWVGDRVNIIEEEDGEYMEPSDPQETITLA